MKDVLITLKSKRQLTPTIWELRFTGDFTETAKPGQFVNIEIDGLFLRRPVSVADRNGDELTLVVRAVGAGTAALCEARAGDSFKALCFLGNGFDILSRGSTPILVGGGVGVPPLYLLAKELIKEGVKPAVALGFANNADAFYLDEFRALGLPVFAATLDGSLGEKGFVTDAIKKNLSSSDYAFCCGPEPMLKAVYDLANISGGQFSFEERMGCGFGACMGCSCKTKYGNKRICKDGPVLKMEEIIW